MARLDDIRDSLLLAPDGIPVQAEVTVEDDDDLGWGPEEEDFDEALALMQHTCKLLRALLARVKMSSVSKHMITKHRDDLLQFIAEYPPSSDNANVEVVP